jgi:hypothetical protein
VEFRVAVAGKHFHDVVFLVADKDVKLHDVDSFGGIVGKKFHEVIFLDDIVEEKFHVVEMSHAISDAISHLIE